jgi:hypothetical protein
MNSKSDSATRPWRLAMPADERERYFIEMRAIVLILRIFYDIIWSSDS